MRGIRHGSLQVRAICRNDTGSNSILRSTFATDVGCNFSIGVRNTTNHEPLQPIREAFSFQFWGQRSYVTINLIDWIYFKRLGRVPKANDQLEIMNISMENTMQKWTYICKNNIFSCIQTSIQTTKKPTICWLWILNRNMSEYMYFVHDLSSFCVQYTICYQRLIGQILVKSWL